MKIYLCLYSNEKYRIPKKILKQWALVSGCFDEVFDYDREWLISTDFYENNKSVLDDPNSRGDGWWLWKPYIIKKSLERINDGDILVYLDSSDTFFGDFRNFLINHFSGQDLLLTRAGENRNSWYTKRDAFFYMGCDSKEYWNSLQLEAGVFGAKKSSRSTEFIDEWIKYCQDYRIVSNGPNECGLTDLDGYIAHRNDQSVLTNLGVKYQEPSNHDVIMYVLCNMWDLLSNGEINEFNNKVWNVCNMYGGGSSLVFRIWYVNYVLPLTPSRFV